MIRILTKPNQGENISEIPLMKNRLMVRDIVEKIDRDLVKYFQFAGMWYRLSDSIKVALKFKLMDNCIVEITLYNSFPFR